MSETSNKNFNHDNHINNVIAPERPIGFGGTPEQNENTPNKKKVSLRTKLIAGGVGIALVAGAAVGIGLSNSGEKPAEAPQTSEPAENPTKGTETENTEALWYETMNLDPTAEEIIIDAATVAPEDLPELYYNDRLSTWLNSGYSLDFANGIHEMPNFKENSAEVVAAEYDQLFIDNMIATTPGIGALTVMNNITTNHGEVLTISAMTSFPELSRLDKVPYMRAVELVSYDNLTVSEDGTVEFTATYREYNNSDQNSAGENPNITSNFVEETNSQIVVFTVEDGAYKLQDVRSVE